MVLPKPGSFVWVYVLSIFEGNPCVDLAISVLWTSF